jgi:hypothetical protein
MPLRFSSNEPRRDPKARRPLFRRLVSASLIVSVLLGNALPAFAQDAKELTRLRSVFQQGLELEQAGNWSAAVQRFREVGQVRMTPQVRFHIALCEEKLGRLVAALGGYELALGDADTVNPDFRLEVETNVKRLRERIPKLVIQRGAGAEAAVIELDGVAVGESSVGVDVPQDPGPHAVTARAPNYQPFESTVTLAEGERKTVEIVLQPAPRDVMTQPGGGAGSLEKTSMSKLRLTSFIVGGVGAASLLTSGVLFALKLSTQSRLDANCPTRRECPPGDKDDGDRLKTYHYSSMVTFGVGLAAVGTGVTLFVVDLQKQKKASQEQQTGLRVLPLLAPGLAGAEASVRF